MPNGAIASRSSKVSSAFIIFLPFALYPRAFFIFSINVLLPTAMLWIHLFSLLRLSFKPLYLFFAWQSHSIHRRRSLGNFKRNSLLWHRWVIYPVKPFLPLFIWGMPDITGNIMSFCTSHFSSILLMGQFWGENRSIKADLETFLSLFSRNVSHLAWLDALISPIASASYSVFFNHSFFHYVCFFFWHLITYFLL